MGDNKLQGLIEVKVNKAIADVKKLRKEMRAMGKDGAKGAGQADAGVRKMKGGMKLLNTSTVVATLSVGALVGGLFKLGKTAVTTFAQFDRSMAKLRAISGLVGKQSAEYQKMEGLIRQMGRTTQFTASQSADALKVLKQAGLETSQAMETLEATLALAVGTGEDLTATAETMAGVLNSYNLAGTESSRVADVMASSFSNSNLNLERFREAMKFAGTSANLVGVSLEETTAVLGVLANNMIIGTRAGTEMNRLFIELNDSNSKIVKSLGGASLQTNSLQEILEIASQKGIGFNQVMADIGIRGGRAFNVLLKNTEQLKELSGVVNDATGEIQRMREEMENTLSGDFKKLGSAWESLMIDMGNSSEGFFRWLTQKTTDYISGISKVISDRDYGAKNIQKFSEEVLNSADNIELMNQLIDDNVTVSGFMQKEWTGILRNIVDGKEVTKEQGREIGGILKLYNQEKEAQRGVLEIEKQITELYGLGLKLTNDQVVELGVLRRVQIAGTSAVEKQVSAKQRLAILEKVAKDTADARAKQEEISAERDRQRQADKEKADKKEAGRLQKVADMRIKFSQQLRQAELEQELAGSTEKADAEMQRLQLKHTLELEELDRLFEQERIKKDEHETLLTELQARHEAERKTLTKNTLSEEEKDRQKHNKALLKIFKEEGKFYGEMLGSMVTADSDAWKQMRTDFINHILTRIQGYMIEAIAGGSAKEVAKRGLPGLITAGVLTGLVTASFTALKSRWSSFQATGHAQGGLIEGAGGSREDQVPINASPNEYMLDARTVRNKGLQSVKQYHRGFADGGSVTNNNQNYTITQNFPERMTPDQVVGVMKDEFTYGEFRDIGKVGGFN